MGEAPFKVIEKKIQYKKLAKWIKIMVGLLHGPLCEGLNPAVKVQNCPFEPWEDSGILPTLALFLIIALNRDSRINDHCNQLDTHIYPIFEEAVRTSYN